MAPEGLTDEAEAAPQRRIIKDAAGYYWATGRRKASTARVRVRPGSGSFLVNGRELKEYFPDTMWQASAVRALTILEKEKAFDVVADVKGGGKTGQSDAVSLGVARAMRNLDPECYAALRAAGLMTRDARVKERKKYGLAGARKAYQFSKR